jgi:PAS domain S-box-containing protein
VRLALVSVSSTLPLLCGAIYLIDRYTTKDIRFTEHEQRGILALKPLQSLLEAVPGHGTLALRRIDAGRSAMVPVQRSEEQIDTQFAKLADQLGHLDEDLAASASEAAKEWGNLKTRTQSGDKAVVEDGHARLTQELIGLNTRLGDSSNLILDPELDSYYLADAALNAVPNIDSALSRATTLGVEACEEPYLSTEYRVRLATTAEAIRRTDIDRLLRDVGTALSKDAQFRGETRSLQEDLPPALSAWRNSMNAFMARFDAVGGDRPLAISEADFAASSVKARGDTFRLLRVIDRVLGDVLQDRIDQLDHWRLFGTGLILLSLLLSAGVTTRAFRSINRVEQDLRASEQRFRSYFEQTSVGVAITSSQGTWQAINERLCEILGYSREELLERSWSDVTHPDDRAASQALLARSLSGEIEGFTLDKRYVRKDGGVVHARLSSRCVRAKNGSAEYLVTLVQDISAQKAAEAEKEEGLQREEKARKDFTEQLIASQENDRRRIAGEIHDGLGQELLLIKNKVQLLSGVKDATAPIREECAAIGKLASLAIQEARQISHDLRPYQLDQLGLTGAIKVLVDGVAASTQIAFECRLEEVDELFQPEKAIHLYRLVQECLNNIVKHSGAGTVRVIVERDLRDVVLLIEDDGKGFSRTVGPGGAGSQGFGLKNMAERGRIIGAALKVDSEPGKGTRVEVVVPFEAAVQGQ